jgi:Tol biopolymer transport system component
MAVGGQTGQIGAFSASENGVLAYIAAVPIYASQLAWFDRAGKQVGALGDQADYGDVELAPDGSRVAVTIYQQQNNPDIWLYDVGRTLRTRFTFDPAIDFGPIWSPDGSRIVFDSTRGRLITDLYQRPSSGAGEDEVLFADDSTKQATSWSHDGRFLLYRAGANTFNAVAGSASVNLWVLPLSGDRKPSPFIQTKFAIDYGRFSPDSRWVAYVSNESGRDEV